MSVKDLQLKGNNFCDMECVDRNSIIHPETCVNQVLTGNNNADNTAQDLSDWLAKDTASGYGFTGYSSLLQWLNTNYPISQSGIPIATYSTLGGVIIDHTDNILNINASGLLSVNKSALGIPTLNNAAFSTKGIIKLGNDTILTTDFENTFISGQTHDAYTFNGHVYALPLRLDNQGRAGVVIPTGLFNTGSGSTSSPWTFDWSKKVTTYDPETSTTGGTSTKYILLGNKNLATSNGELGYDSDGNISTNYGYPRFALVAGGGISFTRYTNRFISASDRASWGADITEILITANEIPTLSTTAHDLNTNYTIQGSGYSSSPSKFLREDGTWQTIEGGNYDTLDGTGSTSGTSYVVNGSGYIQGATPTKFLREDGAWETNIPNVTYQSETFALNDSITNKSLDNQTNYTCNVSGDGNLYFYLPSDHKLETSIVINKSNSSTIKIMFYINQSTPPVASVSTIVLCKQGTAGFNMTINSTNEYNPEVTSTKIVISIRHKIAYIYEIFTT